MVPKVLNLRFKSPLRHRYNASYRHNLILREIHLPLESI